MPRANDIVSVAKLHRYRLSAAAGTTFTPVYWLIQTHADLPPDDDWLSASERAVLDTLRFKQRRQAWRLGRWTAKCALSAFLTPSHGSIPPLALAILASETGAPTSYLRDDPAPAALSISHRDDRACSTVAPPGVELGCDLEVIEPRSTRFVSDYFTVQERDFVATKPADEHPFWINLIWSAKESALKALQTGLRLDTRRVIVELPEDAMPNGPWHSLSVHYPDQERVFNGWHRRLGDHVLTVVAAPSPTAPVSLWGGEDA